MADRAQHPEEQAVRDRVIVWLVPLSTSLPADRLACLSAPERARAAKFQSETLAQYWRVARVALREAVASAISTSPVEVPIAIGSDGKPFLDGGPPFNLSHSGAYALVAIGTRAQVGVDVEEMRPLVDLADIAHSHFAAEERAEVLALPEPERTIAFYRVWTRKEAFVKASGIGVGPALQRFAVSTGVDPCIRRVDAGVPLPRARVCDIPVPEGYAAALVSAAAALDVDLRTWGARSP